jgi:hypothetical protein
MRPTEKPLAERIAEAVIREIAEDAHVWRRVDAHMAEMLQNTPHEDAYLCLGDTPDDHRVELNLFGSEDAISLPVKINDLYTEYPMHPEDGDVTLRTVARMRSFAAHLLEAASKAEAEVNQGVGAWQERFGNKA